MTPARDVLLRTPLRDLTKLWLEPTCPQGCLRVTQVPVKMLARRRGNLLLGDLVRRMRCSSCGKHPERVVATEDIQAGAPGSGTEESWRVQLLP